MQRANYHIQGMVRSIYPMRTHIHHMMLLWNICGDQSIVCSGISVIVHFA